MNPAISSYLASENWTPLNNYWYKLLQLLLERSGESVDKYACLAPGCGGQLRFKVIECRKSEWVQFLVSAYLAGVQLPTLPDVCGCSPLEWSKMVLE